MCAVNRFCWVVSFSTLADVNCACGPSGPSANLATLLLSAVLCRSLEPVSEVDVCVLAPELFQKPKLRLKHESIAMIAKQLIRIQK